MENTYKNIGYFFVVLLGFVVLGFYKTYFIHFPTFKEVNTVKQFHGAMLFSWFVLLIVQPFLLRYRKYKAHRMLGKFAYILVPMVMVSIFMVSKQKYLTNYNVVPMEENIGDLAMNIPSIFYFALLFTLAMVYKKNGPYHMRFMIANALFIFSPGFGRAFIIYGGVTFSQSVVIAITMIEIITLILLLFDVWKGKPYTPYLLTIFFLISFHLTWVFRLSEPWQYIGANIAGLFF